MSVRLPLAALAQQTGDGKPTDKAAKAKAGVPPKAVVKVAVGAATNVAPTPSGAIGGWKPGAPKAPPERTTTEKIDRFQVYADRTSLVAFGPALASGAGAVAAAFIGTAFPATAPVMYPLAADLGTAAMAMYTVSSAIDGANAMIDIAQADGAALAGSKEGVNDQLEHAGERAIGAVGVVEKLKKIGFLLDAADLLVAGAWVDDWVNEGAPKKAEIDDKLRQIFESNAPVQRLIKSTTGIEKPRSLSVPELKQRLATSRAAINELKKQPFPRDQQVVVDKLLTGYLRLSDSLEDAINSKTNGFLMLPKVRSSLR